MNRSESQREVARGGPRAAPGLGAFASGDVRAADSRPVFLVGAERSGTTLLRLMLDHHPGISFFSEFEFVVQQIGDDGSWPEIRAFHEWLRVNRMFTYGGFTADPALSFPDLIRSFLRQRQEKNGKPVVGATVHEKFHHLTLLWPECRILHIIRDPRDVARSCITIGWSGNCWWGASKWIEAEHTWDRLRSTLSVDRWHEVRYEELVSRPEETLRGVCAFLGVEYSDRMLAYPEDSTYEPTKPSLAFQWKHRAPARDVRLAEARVGRLLTARGYEPSGLPAMRLGLWGRVTLRLEDRWKRFRFRHRRFGARLFWSEFLSRRLGIGPWWRRCIVRMHEIQEAHAQ